MREQWLDQEQLQSCRYGPCLVLGFRLVRVLNDRSEGYLIPHLIFQIYTEYSVVDSILRTTLEQPCTNTC